VNADVSGQDEVHVRVRICSELYALPVGAVLEVATLGEVGPVPGAPSTAVGIRNLRGQVLPVFDVASLFGLRRDGAPARRMLVADDGGRRAGIVIDEVTDVAPLSGALQEADSRFLSCAVLEEGALVGVVDVPALFDALEAR